MRSLLLTAALLAPLAARAHVTLDPSEAPPGATLRATFRVPHGCGEAGTTRLSVALPEGTLMARPMPKPGWTVRVERRALEAPVPGPFGGTLRELPTAVTWEGGPLPSDLYDEFVVLLRTPDAGEVVALPTTQGCEGGRVAAWTEAPEAGHAGRPAPALRLVQAAPPPAAERRVGDLVLAAPWTRAAGAGGQGAGYLVIGNRGAAADRLLSASTPAARTTELHTHLRDGDVMRMRPVDSIPVPANGEVRLEPGGLHLMLIGLTAPLRVGERVPVTLVFERAGTVQVELPVQPAGARGPAGAPAVGGHAH